MAEVVVQVDGRSYRLACEDGEEPHLTAMAARVDAATRSLPAALRQNANEGRLMLMAALLVADRLAEAEARVAKAERRAAEAKTAAEDARRGPDLFASQRAAAMADRIHGVADRIEDLAARLSED